MKSAERNKCFLLNKSCVNEIRNWLLCDVWTIFIFKAPHYGILVAPSWIGEYSLLSKTLYYGLLSTSNREKVIDMGWVRNVMRTTIPHPTHTHTHVGWGIEKVGGKLIKIIFHRSLFWGHNSCAVWIMLTNLVMIITSILILFPFHKANEPMKGTGGPVKYQLRWIVETGVK